MRQRAKFDFCYYCDKEITDDNWVIKPVHIQTHGQSIDINRKFHYDCLPRFLEENKEKSKKRKQELSDWDELYMYVKKEILHIQKGTNLAPHWVQRIQGLRVGQYMPTYTNTRVIKRGYSYKTILNTFKYCKRSIDWAMKHKTFSDANHQIDYMMAIVMNNIEFINQKMLAVEKTQKKVEKLKKEEVTAGRSSVYKKKGTGQRKVTLV